MQGYFDVQTKDLGGLRDNDLLAMMSPDGKVTPELARLVDGLPTVQHARGKNLVSDNFAGATFKYVFSGGSINDPYNQGNGILASILIMNTDSEPGYTDQTDQYTTIHGLSGNVGSLPGKRFIEDDVEAHLIITDSGGRESILFRSRWLYLAAEAVSNDIRSLGVYHCRYGGASLSSIERGRIARIRLKDSGGSPIIINKTASQVLLIEYRFTLVSI